LKILLQDEIFNSFWDIFSGSLDCRWIVASNPLSAQVIKNNNIKNKKKLGYFMYKCVPQGVDVLFYFQVSESGQFEISYTYMYICRR